MSRVFRLAKALSVAAALTGFAHGQIAAMLQLPKTQYLAGEPVIANISITNHSGRTLTFYSDGRTQWLDFVVRNGRNEPVNNRSNAIFGKMTLQAGQTLTRQVNLADHFLLNDPGNYSAVAVIHMSDGSEGGSTNRIMFNQSTGSTYWKQKVGLTAKPGETREFRIVNFNGDKSAQIYAQVINDRTGQSVSTFPLGDVLMLRKPLVTVDNKQRMHLLYMSTPTLWVHCEVDTDGRLTNREIHQRLASGDPQLLTYPGGEVRVANSVIYDPRAAEEATKKARKASDRPAGL